MWTSLLCCDKNCFIQALPVIGMRKTKKEGIKMKKEPEFRFARREDVPLILQFIRELADYEQLLSEVVAIRPHWNSGYSTNRRQRSSLPWWMEKKSALRFSSTTSPTFLGRAGLYLEDLYVQPEYRGNGYGKAILTKLAAIAVERGCGRLEWWCLDWNKPSIEFYRSLGAQPMDEWTVYRIAGDALTSLAGE